MKKLFILAVATLVMYSCNNNESLPEAQHLKTLSGKDVNFKSGKEMHNNTITDRRLYAEVGFAFVIFRKSTNCLDGWGICRIAAFWINIYNSARFDNEPNYCEIIKDTNGQYVGIIELSSAMPAGYDTKFYVDEDLEIGTAFTVKSGVYTFDRTLGVYGGYTLRAIKK